MKTFLLVFILFLVKYSVSKPTNFDYDESYSNDDQLFNVSPTQIDVNENDDSNPCSLESSEIVKREIKWNNNSSPIEMSVQSVGIFNLSDIIYRIEKAFLKSASNIIQAFKDFRLNHTFSFDLNSFDKNSTDSNDNNDDKRPFISFIQRIQKRAVSENETEMNNSSLEVNNMHESEDPQKSSINKVALYSNVGYFPLIPSFDYHLLKRNTKEETKFSDNKNENLEFSTKVIEAENKRDNNNTTEILKNITTEQLPFLSQNTDTQNNSKETSTEKTIVSKGLLPDTSTSSSSSSSTSTTKDPIKELKENEEEVKEKIAEIEAEPIILSSRI